MPKWSFSKNWPPFKSPSSKMGPDPVCARFSRSMKTSSKARRGYQRPLSSDALNFPFTTSPLRKNKATSLCLLFAQQHFHEHFLSACDARARDTKLFPRMHSHILSAASKIQERNLTPQQQECAYIGQGSLSLVFCQLNCRAKKNGSIRRGLKIAHCSLFWNWIATNGRAARFKSGGELWYLGPRPIGTAQLFSHRAHPWRCARRWKQTRRITRASTHAEQFV